MSTADALTCLAFSPDSQKIASGTARSGVTITTISLESKHQLGTLADAHTYVTAIAWSPDGEKIISALPDHTIRCWNTTSTLPIGQPFKGHNDLIFTAGFLPDSSHAISFSRDGELLVWDTGSGVVTQQVTVSNAAQTTFVAALSADSGLLVTTDTKQGVAWEIPKCARIAEIALPDVPLLQAAIIIPNGRPRVVLGFGDRSVWIWDANTGKHEDVRFEGLDKGDIPLAMAVSPDGKLLALEIESDIDHPTHFYDMNGHKLTTSNLRCTHPFAFSPDGKLFAASSIPSDSKDGSHKLIVRSVEEILGGSPLDLPATITLKAKGKQRSLGLNPAFFDQPPPASINTNGRPQASPRTNAKGILPLPKIWQRIRHPRSSEAKSKVREPQQMPPRPASRERATAPLANLWTRIRHRPSHRAASIPILEVPTAQAKRRIVVSRRHRKNTRSQSMSTEGSAQASSDIRDNHKEATASPLRQTVTSQHDLAQSSRQASQPGHPQGHDDRRNRESLGSGIVYAERDTHSVKAHGCWNVFWNWLCYKAL